MTYFSNNFFFVIGHLTSKSDVYSFGVVLLELLSGRRSLDKNRPPGEHNLVEWARPYLSSKRKVFRVLDPRLGSQYSLTGAHKASQLALQCLSMDSKCRPNMEQVVAALEQLQDLKDVPRAAQPIATERTGERSSRNGHHRPSHSPLKG